GAGKSQLAIVARELIGEHNCAELRVKHLDDRFEIARFLGKSLLMGADVSGDFLSYPSAFRLKGMTGDDLLACERKHSNVLFYITVAFNILITCNSRLVIALDSDRGAWARRLILFLYDQAQQLKNIRDFGHLLIETEGSGILNWALEGLLMLFDDIEKLGAVDMTNEQKTRVDSLLNESEGVLHFVKNCIKAEQGKDLTSEEIIEKYGLYCADPSRRWNANMNLVLRRLPSIMLQLFQTVQSTNIVRNNKNARGYRNVTFA